MKILSLIVAVNVFSVNAASNKEFIDKGEAQEIKKKLAYIPGTILTNQTGEELNDLNISSGSRNQRLLQYQNRFPGPYNSQHQNLRFKRNPNPLPKNFDLRLSLQNCTRPVITQSTCNSCWAIVIANLVSDRFCLQGINVSLSIQDLLECSTENKCCEGGWASKGYEHMITHGIIEEKYKAYDAECGTCRSFDNATNATRYKCKAGSIWFSGNVEAVKWELVTRGPVGAVFDLYDDLTIYRNGVYTHKEGKSLGPHAVQVMGWGTDEKGVEYWICRNSWGDAWGLKGDFNIKIGECRINEFMSACEPLVE
eukprot:TRINITY_DN1001_c0_g1_i5.p1 TRINITY_DN1001_c0_g1~~TRINITY_DN1001_c0_g1_i5.p1  ORF type:complete len:310 (-),score=48.82 TRINITY_DN1001_c0_g1_i5:161-1090(-)